MKTVQSSIICFIDFEDNIEENFESMTKIFKDQKINNDRNKLKMLLRLIAGIIDNHYRVNNFFTKVERILLVFKKDIKNFYTNWEIFNIFKSNKRILLFFFQQKIITFDEYIIKTMYSNKYMLENYLLYFLPEIRNLKKEKWFLNLRNKKYDYIVERELPENFLENRIIGENHSSLCKIIRDDLIDDFIFYFNSFMFRWLNIIMIQFKNSVRTHIKNFYPW